MPEATVTNRNPALRRDLRSIQVDGRQRAYRIIIDEISGRFTRVSEHVWQALTDNRHDETIWQEARAAGWTRERTQPRQKAFSPLFFRIPIGSIDGVAARLAPLSGIAFSSVAVLFWGAAIAVAALLALSHSAELFASLGSLKLFLAQSDPVWLAVSLVATKVAHEFAHAVMCRRMGSRCGSVGLLILCGVPCPYCDVTDIWRERSAVRRAAVMLAGIYIEWIIAALATFTWVFATDPVVRLHALNLMVVCGISTIVFNANPLMRYDGYYVLADLVGSTNLRQQSRDSFRNVVTTRFAGPAYHASKRSDVRSLLLACFHAASVSYRFVIAIAIATLLLGAAQYLNLRPLAIGIVIAWVIAWGSRLIRRIGNVLRGTGRWGKVSSWRRSLFTLTIGLFLLSMLFVPLPRYRTATGRIDAVSTSTVFLPCDGMVENVAFDFGDTVRGDENLLSLRSESLSIEHAKLSGQLRVAKLRSRLTRRITLGRLGSTEQWKTLQAAEDAVATQLASVQERVVAAKVTAPIDGVVLPIPPSANSLDSVAARSLRDRIGTAADAHQAWCRISPDGKLDAVLVMDARDRASVHAGTSVMINLSESPQDVFASKVTSVSAIQQDQSAVTRRAAYHVLCPLPVVEEHELLRWIGKECRGVIRLPNRTLVSDAANWISEWLFGE